MRNELIERLSRAGRSILTLNRDREYMTLKKMLRLKPADVLLDVGCGDGFWTSRLAQTCRSVVGLEPDRKTLEYAQALHSLSNVTYVCGVAESLPFSDGSFDKILSVSCLEHFADPWRGIGEMARVLKPGGRLALSVDSLLPDNSSQSFREWHKDRHFVTHYFSQDTLTGALQTAGLNYEPESVAHLFRSRIAAKLRQVFIRRPRLWLPLFPAFYLSVRASDRLFNDMHGQIIVVAASR
jgi:ubiquinone/menaquinone biosynthesis C-methylase UbiE